MDFLNHLFTRAEIDHFGMAAFHVVFMLVFATFIFNMGIIVWCLLPRKEY